MLDIFSCSFMQYALIVGVLVSLCAALLGVLLVLRRFSMIGDGLSHVGFGALSVAFALRIAPMLVAVPIVILSAFVLLGMSESKKIKGDSMIAVLSSSALAIGVVANKLAGNQQKANLYFELLLCELGENNIHTTDTDTAKKIKNIIHRNPEKFHSNKI